MEPEELIGEQLTSVEFFIDQIALHFDAKVLTLFAWPLAADSDGVTVAFGEPVYRDAICSVIGQDVEKATFIEGVELTMEFDNGIVIALSLREEDLTTPEAGVFSSPEGIYEF